MPASIRPQLASLRTSPPESDHWLHEIKYDGYRTLARISPNGTRLITRNGFDWTGYYGRLASVFDGLELQEAILDGEVAVQEPSGVTSLSALEQALSSRHTEQLIFIAFDLIHLDGHDLTRVPLIQRKKALRELLGAVPENSPLQLSDYLIGRGAALFAEACRMGLEGIVCKRTDATYRPGRSTTWLKVKSRLQGEFVIVGYTESKPAGGLGALLLAERSGGALVFVGKVGTGFSGREAEMLRTHLRVVRREDPCLSVPKEFRRASANWAEPKLIAAVRYATRTVDGYLRHPVFEELIGLDAWEPKE